MAKEKYDFFDDDDENEIIEPEEKIETPEEKEEKEIANDTITRGFNRLRLITYSVATLIVVWIGVWLWMRYFSPYTVEAKQTGRIMELKCKGLVFSTYEGLMLSEKYVDYPDKWMEYDFPFSITNDSIARKIMNLQGTGKRVRLTYEEYQGIIPWRGSSHRIVTDYEIIEDED